MTIKPKMVSMDKDVAYVLAADLVLQYLDQAVEARGYELKSWLIGTLTEDIAKALIKTARRKAKI